MGYGNSSKFPGDTNDSFDLVFKKKKKLVNILACFFLNGYHRHEGADHYIHQGETCVL